MGAINATAGQNGPRSATFTIPASNGSDTVSNAQIVATMAPGPLKDLFSATYANAAAFAAAAAAAGLAVSHFGDVTFSAFNIVAAASTPSLAVTAGAAGTVVVKMSVSHSISQ